MRRYLWCFPGLGKSSLQIEGLLSVDADCELFKFRNVSADALHSAEGGKNYQRDESYPGNYLGYIRSVEADVVLLNCHISLLEQLDKEQVLVVFPGLRLLPEYLERYKNRGDHPSFIAFMAEEAEGMIRCIEDSGFDSYKVMAPNMYLQDLFERNDFKMKIMTRSELAEQIKRAKDLDILGFDNEKQALVCDLMFVGDNSIYNSSSPLSAEVLADDVLDGKYGLDIDQLINACIERERVLSKEREKLISYFQRAIDLNVLDTDKVLNAIVCDLTYASDGTLSTDYHDAHDLAEAVMSGKYEVDLDNLLEVCKQREQQLEELKLADRRGGLSREELADKIMQGIVNGALSIHYGEIAPYSKGYEVTFGGAGPVGSTRDFKNRWECYRCDLFEVPEKIVSMIERERQSGRVFGNKTETFDVHKMLQAIEEMEVKQIMTFTPEKETDFERWGARGYRSRGSIASVMDVHAGKGLDGIVQHHYHGDYYSMTPVKQNDLVETLVFMKGFCLDCLGGLAGGLQEQRKVIDYLLKHGTDISSPEKLQLWIKENPEKCGYQDNRKISLAAQIAKSAAQVSGQDPVDRVMDKER